jgi:hypothetical protein
MSGWRVCWPLNAPLKSLDGVFPFMCALFVFVTTQRVEGIQSLTLILLMMNFDIERALLL